MSRVIELSGPEGNSFHLLSLANNLGRQLGMDAEKLTNISSQMRSSDYKNLVKIFIENFGLLVDVYYNGKPYELEPEFIEEPKKRKLVIRSLARVLTPDQIK